MKSIIKNWSGTELFETIKYNDKLFRIVTGRYNGGSTDSVEMWTELGWKFVIGKHDIGIPPVVKDVSYVHPEVDRKRYAETLNIRFKDTIKKLF